MTPSLDLDQLRTFVAIADTGSFTRAGDVIFKTQSAVSMQMRRLEERIGKPIFTRDGRASRLTEEGKFNAQTKSDLTKKDITPMGGFPHYGVVKVRPALFFGACRHL